MNEHNHYQTSTPDAENTGELRTISGPEATGKVHDSIGFRSEREAIERLCLKVFGATPVYPDQPAPAPSATCDMRHCPVCKPKAPSATPDECDDLATLQRVERELAEAIRERDEASNKLFAQFAQKHLTCGWCMKIMPPPPGFEPPMTVEKHKATVLSHLMECPKYPARETERELAEARAQRDRLAEALKGYMTATYALRPSERTRGSALATHSIAASIATAALAAVKGESAAPENANCPSDAAPYSLPAVVYVVATGGFRIAIECERPLPLDDLCASAIERFLSMGAPELGGLMEITECSDDADASDPHYVCTESQLRKVGRLREPNS